MSPEILADLQRVLGRAHGYAAVSVFPSRRTEFVVTTRLDELTEVVEQMAEAGDVYLNVSTLAEPPTKGRGGAADALALTGLTLDVDCHDPAAHKGENYPPRDYALQLIAGLPLPPTVLVDTGHGYLARWLLDPAPVMLDAEQRKQIADLSSAWQQHAHTLWAAEGFDLDNTSDLARLTRVVGTFNRKAGQVVPVVVVEESGRYYTVEEISAALQAVQPAPEPARPAQQSLGGPQSAGGQLDGASTADDFATVDWFDPRVLGGLGFEIAHGGRGDTINLRHPAAESGADVQATIGANGVPVLVIHSQSTAAATGLPIGPGHKLTKFAVYARRFHGGDLSAAARQLNREDGFGPQRQTIPPVQSADAFEEEWPEPEPFTEPTRLPFPVAALPKWIGDYVQAFAELYSMPVDLPAQLAVAVLSAVGAGHVKMRAGAATFDTNLYTAVVMPSGTGKSPAFSAFVKPLQRFERHLVEVTADAVRRSNVERQILMADLERAEQSAKKNISGGNREEDADAIEQAQRALDDHEPVPQPRITFDDVTPEKLIELLDEQKRPLVSLSAEGGSFDGMIGRYSDKAYFDVYLKAWSGEQLRYDRKNTPLPRVLDHPLLVYGIALQPSVIEDAFSNKQAVGRGLLARFMIAWPASAVGFDDHNYVDNEVDPAIVDAYSDRMYSLAVRLEGDFEHVVRFDSDALAERKQWGLRIERRKRADGDLNHVAEHVQKVTQSTVRLAALLAVAGGADTVDVAVWRRAAAIGDYWAAHARVVADAGGVDGDETAARVVLEKLRAHAVDGEITRAELYRSHLTRAQVPTVPAMTAVLDVLVEMGWVRVERRKRPGGGRPSEVVVVNPAIYETYETSQLVHSFGPAAVDNSGFVDSVGFVLEDEFQDSSSSSTEPTDTRTPRNETYGIYETRVIHSCGAEAVDNSGEGGSAAEDFDLI